MGGGGGGGAGVAQPWVISKFEGGMHNQVLYLNLRVVCTIKYYI